MFGLSFSEVVVIAIVGVLLFGGRLPEIARSLGKIVYKLQKGFNELKNEIDSEKK